MSGLPSILQQDAMELLREKVGPLERSEAAENRWCERPIWRWASPGWDYDICGVCWTCRARAALAQEGDDGR